MCSEGVHEPLGIMCKFSVSLQMCGGFLLEMVPISFIKFSKGFMTQSHIQKHYSGCKQPSITLNSP